MNIIAILKSYVPLLLLIVVFSQSWVTSVVASEQTQKLKILNWAEYLDPDLVKEFEHQFNVKVIENYFETDSDRDAIFVRTDGSGYDLAIIDGSSLKFYRQQGWLAPLKESRLDNLQHIDPRWKNAFVEASDYAVPYFWGTLGIAYRADLVPEPITHWRQLLQPPEALRGRITMIGDNRELFVAALAALGYSVNSTRSQELAAAETLLLAQKPYVRGYSYVALTQESELVTGAIAATMAYSGDTLMLQELHESIKYALPEEGSILWVDYLAVMASSDKKELAMDFINFLNKPENAARLAQFVYYATPNKAAEKLLPKEFLADPVIYPPQVQLDRSEFLMDLTPRAMRKYTNAYFNVMR